MNLREAESSSTGHTYPAGKGLSLGFWGSTPSFGETAYAYFEVSVSYYVSPKPIKSTELCLKNGPICSVVVLFRATRPFRREVQATDRPPPHRPATGTKDTPSHRYSRQPRYACQKLRCTSILRVSGRLVRNHNILDKELRWSL